MPIDEARGIAEKVLGDDWKITEIGSVDVILADYRLGNEPVFGRKGSGIGYGYGFSNVGSIIGTYGFAIHRYNSYEGFISADKGTKKVNRISFGGEILEAIYGDGKNKIDIEEFVEQFTKNFDLPDFNWIPQGWYYESPNGYGIMIKTDRLIDIKMDEKLKAKSESSRKKTQINF